MTRVLEIAGRRAGAPRGDEILFSGCETRLVSSRSAGGSTRGWVDPWEDLSLFPRTARRPSPTLPKSVHATQTRPHRWSLLSAICASRSGV